MKKLFTLILAGACFTVFAQSDIDYPYNPDFENDGFVGIEDVLELLSVYGTPFTPEQLLLDGASLTEIIESLQSQIDSLASYANEGFGAIALNDSLLTEYLVGVAASSEEGDSTLGAWVMQLSEVVEQQQVQLDSLALVESSAVEDTFEVEWQYSDTIHAPTTSSTILVTVDSLWFEGPFWQVRGYDNSNLWHEYQNVAFSEILDVASGLSSLWGIYIDYMPYGTLVLDSCLSQKVVVGFNRTTDFGAMIDRIETEILDNLSNYHSNFKFELERSPNLRIRASELSVSEISLCHVRASKGSPSADWSISSGLICGSHSGAVGLLKLEGGQWVTY